LAVKEKTLLIPFRALLFYNYMHFTPVLENVKGQPIDPIFSATIHATKESP